MRKINFTKPKKRLAAVVSGVLAVILLLNEIGRASCRERV